MQAELGEPGVSDPLTWTCHPQSSKVVGVHPERSQAQQPGYHHQESTCSCYTSQRYICPAADSDTCQNNAGAAQEQRGEDQTLCQANPWVSLVWTCHRPALLQLWVLHLQAALPKSIRPQQEQCLHWPRPDTRPLTFHSWTKKWSRPRHGQTCPSLSPLRGDGGSEDQDQSQRGKDNPHHHGGWSVHRKWCKPLKTICNCNYLLIYCEYFPKERWRWLLLLLQTGMLLVIIICLCRGTPQSSVDLFWKDKMTRWWR